MVFFTLTKNQQPLLAQSVIAERIKNKPEPNTCENFQISGWRESK